MEVLGQFPPRKRDQMRTDTAPPHCDLVRDCVCIYHAHLSLSSRSIASLRLLYTKVKATISSISPVAIQAVGVYVEQVEDTRETELVYSRGWQQ